MVWFLCQQWGTVSALFTQAIMHKASIFQTRGLFLVNYELCLVPEAAIWKMKLALTKKPDPMMESGSLWKEVFD